MAPLLLLTVAFLQAPAAPQKDLVDRAVELIHEEKYEMAYKVLLDAVKDDPTNARAFPFIIAMEIQTGRLVDAEKHLGPLLAHEPDNIDLRELSGQLSMARRDWKRAESEWRFILEQHPNSEQAHMQLAAVLLQEDRYQDALAAVTKALEIAPKRNDARSLRGNILATLGQINQAALDWNVALAGDPDDTVALSGLAVFLRQTDPDQALKYAQRAVELTNWKALGPMRVLAMVYRARGDDADSRAVLTRALMVFPNNETLAGDLRAENSVVAANKSSAATSKSAPATSVKAAPNMVVIPLLAVGGLTLGADAGDLMWMDAKPLPPTAAPEKKIEAAAPPKPALPPAHAPAAAPTGAAAPTPTLAVAAIPPLAFGGLTLGASFSDLVILNRLPSPPPQETAAAPTVATAPPAEEPVRPVLAPAPSRRPAVDLHWGELALSTITPAFVYGTVPPPRENR